MAVAADELPVEVRYKLLHDALEDLDLSSAIEIEDRAEPMFNIVGEVLPEYVEELEAIIEDLERRLEALGVRPGDRLEGE